MLISSILNSHPTLLERVMLAHVPFLLLAIEVSRVAALTLPLARIVGRDVALDASYDFVIIGGGTSGLTVADRLTENPGGMFAVYSRCDLSA
jgi:hypothetical protein